MERDTHLQRRIELYLPLKRKIFGIWVFADKALVTAPPPPPKFV